MDTRLAYIIGQPGSGKSTLMATLTAHLRRTSCPDPPHDLLWRDGQLVGTEIGRRREAFSGTDALAMNIQPRVVAWLAAHPYRNVIAEGDRLGNLKFFQAVQDEGVQVHLIYLDTPDIFAAGRRAQRRSNQNETWLRGRITKIKNLVSQWPSVGHRYITLNGMLSPDELVKELTTHPVIGELL